MQQRDAAVARAPHRSAAVDWAEFLLQDMYEYVQMGFWTVLPYNAVRSLTPLRLAPAGVVPQHDRRPRPIIHYSFYDTNQLSVPLQPKHAMQFGHTLQRILQRLVYCNSTHGPPLLAKIDLADGYYRVPLTPSVALRLAVVIPSDMPDQPLIAVPLTLPMGWSHSPPFFCAFTETVADIANQAITQPQLRDVHPLFQATQQVPLPTHPQFHNDAIVLGSTDAEPLAYHDVYIDNFITVAQQPLHYHTLNTLLHTIDRVFDGAPHPTCRQAISKSKLEKGDATFATVKRILGWDVDTHKMQLSLPLHRLTALTTLLQTYIQVKRVSKRRWAQLLGVLRSSAPALYGASHLFSILQHAATQRDARRIRITHLLRTVLRDWLLLIKDMHHTLAPLHTLVPTAPTLIATTDALHLGLGGAWTTHHAGTTANYLWRTPVPLTLQANLLTEKHPGGSVTINDLELAASIIGATLASQSSPLPYNHLLLGTDNTAACAWLNKGSTTSTSAPAFLLHQLARLHCALNFTLSALYVPGTSNHIADCCSRLLYLSDTDFLHVQPSRYSPYGSLSPLKKNYSP
jgi:hypothetical protein